MMEGGEVFVPEDPEHAGRRDRRGDRPGRASASITGIRPGEKLHEVLVTEDESRHALELDDCYLIYPEFPTWRSEPYRRGEPVPDGLPLRQRHQRPVAERRRAAGDAARRCSTVLLSELPPVRPPDDRRRRRRRRRRSAARPDDHPGPARSTRSSARSPTTSKRGTRSPSPTAPAPCTPPRPPPGSAPATRCSRTPLSFVASSNCALFVGARPRVLGHRPRRPRT